jgi:hypothetical protein
MQEIVSIHKVRKLFVARMIKLVGSLEPKKSFAASFAGLRLAATSPACILNF